MYFGYGQLLRCNAKSSQVYVKQGQIVVMSSQCDISFPKAEDNECWTQTSFFHRELHIQYKCINDCQHFPYSPSTSAFMNSEAEREGYYPRVTAEFHWGDFHVWLQTYCLPFPRFGQLPTPLLHTPSCEFTSSMAAPPKLETIEITLFPSGVAEIAFNRPQRYNALSPQAYRVRLANILYPGSRRTRTKIHVSLQDWLTAIQWAAKCDDAKVTVLTGRGKYYTSGQQLEMPDFSDANLPQEIQRRRNTTK